VVQNAINEDALRGHMSRRRQEQDRAKKVPVSITIDKELFDFIEYGIRMRWWQNRSQAIQMIGHWFMRNQQKMQQSQSQEPQIPPHFGHLPP
jgi:hypothetical protein